MHGWKFEVFCMFKNGGMGQKENIHFWLEFKQQNKKNKKNFLSHKYFNWVKHAWAEDQHYSLFTLCFWLCACFQLQPTCTLIPEFLSIAFLWAFTKEGERSHWRNRLGARKNFSSCCMKPNVQTEYCALLLFFIIITVYFINARFWILKMLNS